MPRSPKNAIRTTSEFAVAGFLAAALWLNPSAKFSGAWFYALGTFFAIAIVLATILQSSRLTATRFTNMNLALAGCLLCVGWPTAVVSVWGASILLDRWGNTSDATVAWSALFVGSVVSSFFISSSIGVLTRWWDTKVFLALLVSGNVVIASVAFLGYLPGFNIDTLFRAIFSDVRPWVALLVVPCLTCYAGIFGIALWRKGNRSKTLLT